MEIFKDSVQIHRHSNAATIKYVSIKTPKKLSEINVRVYKKS